MSVGVDAHAPERAIMYTSKYTFTTICSSVNFGVAQIERHPVVAEYHSGKYPFESVPWPLLRFEDTAILLGRRTPRRIAGLSSRALDNLQHNCRGQVGGVDPDLWAVPALYITPPV